MMKSSVLLTALFGLGFPGLQAASVVNFWDFEGGYADKAGPNNGTAGAEVTSTTGHDGNTAAFFPSSLAGGGAYTSSGYVDIAPQIASIGGGAAPFSFSYWVRLDYDDTTNPRGLFDFSGDGSANDGPQSLYIQSGANAGNLAFRVDGHDGSAPLDGTDNSVAFVDVSGFEGTAESPTGSWFFIAANFDPSSGITLYLNGNSTPAGTGIVSGTINTVDWNADQYLGAFNVNTVTARGLEGGLDDVAIYEGLLTTTHIADLYSGAISPLQIPEPTGSVLALLGGLALLRRRR